MQAAVADLEAGIIQLALQLRRILAQHRQRFRLFDRQMRSDLAIAIDIDADIDAAEIGRIEPDFKTALAASHRCGDLKREPAHRYRSIRRQRDAQGRRGSDTGRRGRERRLDRARRLHGCVR